MMTTCFRRISAPLLYNVPARCAGVCRLEPALWRLGHMPVTECARFQQPQLNGSWLFGLKWAESRLACRSGILQQIKQTPWHARGTVLVYRGGHERSAASFRPLLSLRARGLCSGKSEKAPENREEGGVVPGQGLFKFKELVSVELLHLHGPQE